MVRVLNVRKAAGTQWGEIQEYKSLGTNVIAIVLWRDGTLTAEVLTALTVVNQQ